MWSHPKSAKVQLGGTIITALKIQVIRFPERKIKMQKVMSVPASVKCMKESTTQRAQSEKKQLSHEICTGLAALFCLMVL
jgi:hypothetical protein